MKSPNRKLWKDAERGSAFAGQNDVCSLRSQYGCRIGRCCASRGQVARRQERRTQSGEQRGIRQWIGRRHPDEQSDVLHTAGKAEGEAGAE